MRAVAAGVNQATKRARQIVSRYFASDRLPSGEPLAAAIVCAPQEAVSSHRISLESLHFPRLSSAFNLARFEL
jgi:hypothetical protein